MAESVTIARPYAEATYRVAKETGAQGIWSQRLQKLALIAQNGDMASVMGNPQLSAEQVADLVISLCDDNDTVFGQLRSYPRRKPASRTPAGDLPAFRSGQEPGRRGQGGGGAFRIPH